MSDRPPLIVAVDRKDLARRAADEVVTRARAAIASRGVFHVALAGGSTPRELYATLAREERAHFARWHAWFGDERRVPPDDEKSNFRMATQTLLEPADIPEEHWHPIRVWEGEPEEAAQTYERELLMHLGPSPRFDLVLLGMGADGHVASIFPGSKALEEVEHDVVATFVEKLGAWRVTLTVRAINRSRAVIFLVAGTEKAAALHAVLEGPRDPARFPAQAISPESEDCLWLVDRAAASGLSGPQNRE